MRIIIALAMSLALSGCGMLGGVETGNVTTTYDSAGSVDSVTEEVAIGDPTTEYYRAVSKVAAGVAAGVSAKAAAIKDMAKVLPGDSGEAAAWKTAMATMAIANIPDITPEAIAAVKRAPSGYDVANTAIKEAGDVASVGFPTYGWTKSVEYMASRWSDAPKIEGDGNSIITVSDTGGGAVSAGNPMAAAPEEEEVQPEIEEEVTE